MRGGRQQYLLPAERDIDILRLLLRDESHETKVYAASGKKLLLVVYTGLYDLQHDIRIPGIKHGINV